MSKLEHLFYQVTPESHLLVENNYCWYVGGSAQNIFPAHNPIFFRYYWELGISLFSGKLRYILQPEIFILESIFGNLESIILGIWNSYFGKSEFIISGIWDFHLLGTWNLF